MKSGKREVSLKILTIVLLFTGVLGAFGHAVHAADNMSTAEKNSTYGFFVWLSENAENEADRKDAAVAAQILKGTASDAQIFNDGSIYAGDGTSITSYSTLLTMTHLGEENDATDLKRMRDSIDLIKLGNEYRAKESLHPLKISSALMAMSELSANYQFTTAATLLTHPLTFNALENLASYSAGSYPNPPAIKYDPYTGWYTEEKALYDANPNDSKAGHYTTLTDRKGTMYVTGFGYTYAFRTDEDSWVWGDVYYSQHFSDNSRLYVSGDGLEPDKYITYLNRYECSLKGHTWDDGTITKKPTCVKPGEKTKTCTVCGETQTEEVPALGHDWDKPAYTWAEDYSTGTARRTCKNDKTHFDEETVKTTSEVTKKPTCIKKGETTYTAAFTNKSYYTQTITVEDIEPLGHDWSEEYTVDTEPTCAQEGSKSHHCMRCGEKEPGSELPIEKTDDHSYGDWEVTEEATCTEKGTRAKVCSVCGDTITEDIDALGHDWSEEYTVDKKPTCKEPGSQSRHCSRCEEKIDVEELPADSTAHVFGDWNTVQQPTTTAEGLKERICTVCGEKETETIELLKEKPENEKAADGSAVGAGASAAAAEKAILSGDGGEEGPSGTTFGLLQAKVKKAKNTSITLTWKNIAQKYRIYGNKCRKGQKFKFITTVTGNSYTQSGLTKGTYYKYIIMAVDAAGKVTATSKTLHGATSGKKVSNPKKVTVRKKTIKVGQGKTVKIKASIVKPNGKKVKNHRKLAYESANPKVATVAANGTVKGVSRGSTVIYVYAQNGVFAKVKINVN